MYIIVIVKIPSLDQLRRWGKKFGKEKLPAQGCMAQHTITSSMRKATLCVLRSRCDHHFSAKEQRLHELTRNGLLGFRPDYRPLIFNKWGELTNISPRTES